MTARISRLPRLTMALALLLAFAGHTSAQLLGEVLTVAASTAELHSGIRLPSGSYRVVGEPPASLLARVRDAHEFTDWEAYTARGIAANLQPAFVREISTNFAMAGFFLDSQEERQVGSEAHTRYLYDDGAGGSALLYVIRDGSELVWLIAKSR